MQGLNRVHVRKDASLPAVRAGILEHHRPTLALATHEVIAIANRHHVVACALGALQSTVCTLDALDNGLLGIWRCLGYEFQHVGMVASHSRFGECFCISFSHFIEA